MGENQSDALSRRGLLGAGAAAGAGVLLGTGRGSVLAAAAPVPRQGVVPAATLADVQYKMYPGVALFAGTKRRRST